MNYERDAWVICRVVPGRILIPHMVCLSRETAFAELPRIDENNRAQGAPWDECFTVVQTRLALSTKES